MDDLKLVLHPFTTGHFNNSGGSIVLGRAEQYDVMLSGTGSPTLTKQAAFSTKDVPIPGNIFSGGLQTKGCSVVLDVALGLADLMAANY